MWINPELLQLGNEKMASVKAAFFWYKIQLSAACHHLFAWDNEISRSSGAGDLIEYFHEDFITHHWVN